MRKNHMNGASRISAMPMSRRTQIPQELTGGYSATVLAVDPD
jgi:hypothetical protein